ncbi:hypothetical protein C8Q76DRAFT_800220 [Earliella scabrosa]|nr:hypothetical protein C8Q76DRAFT_800220 [Earliella scabrosa]
MQLANFVLAASALFASAAASPVRQPSSIEENPVTATGVFTVFMPVATAPVNAAGDIPKDIAEALAGAAGTAALEARQDDTNPPVTCLPLPPVGIVCL